MKHCVRPVAMNSTACRHADLHTESDCLVCCAAHVGDAVWAFVLHQLARKMCQCVARQYATGFRSIDNLLSSFAFALIFCCAGCSLEPSLDQVHDGVATWRTEAATQAISRPKRSKHEQEEVSSEAVFLLTRINNEDDGEAGGGHRGAG